MKQAKPPDQREVLAERAGFEPANLFRLHTLQACALGQTTRPLQFERLELYRIFQEWSRSQEEFTRNLPLTTIEHLFYNRGTFILST